MKESELSLSYLWSSVIMKDWLVSKNSTALGVNFMTPYVSISFSKNPFTRACLKRALQNSGLISLPEPKNDFSCVL